MLCQTRQHALVLSRLQVNIYFGLDVNSAPNLKALQGEEEIHEAIRARQLALGAPAAVARALAQHCRPDASGAGFGNPDGGADARGGEVGAALMKPFANCNQHAVSLHSWNAAQGLLKQRSALRHPAAQPVPCMV